MTQKYRKKPVVIEALQFTGNFTEIEEFVGGDAELRDGELLVATLEGPLRAAINDFIIKGVKGEFYPCKPDIFEATYEDGASDTALLEYQQRIIEEKAELDLKIEKLEDYLDSGPKIGRIAKNLLENQYSTMQQYSDILDMRISIF